MGGIVCGYSWGLLDSVHLAPKSGSCIGTLGPESIPYAYMGPFRTPGPKP